MAEGRMLKKRISKSRKFGGLKSDKARLLYMMLMPHLDVDGRIEADAGILKGTVCPYVNSISRAGIRIFLKTMHNAGLIHLYEVDGEWFLQVTRFEDFNRINRDKEAKSHIPTPEQGKSFSGGTPGQFKLSKENISKGEYSDSFLTFWRRFKGRWDADKSVFVKGGKMEAMEQWKTLTDEQKILATAAAAKTGSKITKDAVRWLEYRRWEDFEQDPIAKPIPAAKVEPTEILTLEQKKAIRLNHKDKDKLPMRMRG